MTDQSGEPRYPAFKAIMAGRKKPVTTWTLDVLGIDAAQVGVAGAASAVRTATLNPPRPPGVVVVDDGEGAVQIADFLVGRSLL